MENLHDILAREQRVRFKVKPCDYFLFLEYLKSAGCKWGAGKEIDTTPHPINTKPQYYLYGVCWVNSCLTVGNVPYFARQVPITVLLFDAT